MFASASPDNIKQWKCPEGKFIQNLSGHNAIVNCLAVNPEGVLVSGGDNGTLHFWDWRTGYNFQRQKAAVQPGSMDSEAGIFSMTYDQSGTRLITTEADKTIKIYKEDDTAVSILILTPIAANPKKFQIFLCLFNLIWLKICTLTILNEPIFTENFLLTWLHLSQAY